MRPRRRARRPLSAGRVPAQLMRRAPRASAAARRRSLAKAPPGNSGSHRAAGAPVRGRKRTGAAAGRASATRLGARPRAERAASGFYAAFSRYEIGELSPAIRAGLRRYATRAFARELLAQPPTVRPGMRRPGRGELVALRLEPGRRAVKRSRERDDRCLRPSRQAPPADLASAAAGGRRPPCRRHRQVRPRRRRRAPNPLARLAAAAAALFFVIVAVASIGDVVLLSQQASGRCAPAPVPGGGSLHGVPKRLIPYYVGAANRYSLGARGPGILAAINFVETDFGHNVATSSAGANGWMAFLPSSWQAYGVDADHDGRKDPYDPADAIYAAANLLHASGAPGDWYGAVFAYNHADWYVQKVFFYAKKYSGIADSSPSTASPRGMTSSSCGGGPPSSGGYVNPLGQNADWLPERTDMGVDYAPLHPSVSGARDRRREGARLDDELRVAGRRLHLVPAAGRRSQGRHRLRRRDALRPRAGEDDRERRRSDRRRPHRGDRHRDRLGDRVGSKPRAAPCYSEGMDTNSGKEFTRFMKALGAKVEMDPGPGPDYPTGPLC